MPARLALLLAALTVALPGWANTYKVFNTNDSGSGSLRQQIERANTHPGPDSILFAPAVKGKTIAPLTALPEITDAETTINGDTDDDGAPDVCLDGSSLPEPTSMVIAVRAADCTIRGLAITHGPDSAINVVSAPGCRIYGCHLGVNLAGTGRAPNGRYDIEMWNSPNSEVGGPGPWQRNVLAGGAPGSPNPSDAGLFCASSSGTRIRGNYFGLTRDGMTAFGGGNSGIATLTCESLVIGGTGAGEGNLFGGLRTGAALVTTNNSRVQGNRFGLGADGDRGLTIQDDCLYLSACSANLIGGASASVRNVFAGNATQGIRCVGAGTANNKIRGNYFGLNAGGTKQRKLLFGVLIASYAGYQWVGGPTVEVGNCFACRYPIRFGLGSGAGTTIQNNRVGLKANGTDATGVEEGIAVWGVTVRVLDNTIANVTNTGVLSTEAGANPRVYRNVFRSCLAAVRVISDANCQLGNLGNASTADDGGNQFDSTNGTHIYNLTANRIRAEGNSFGTTSRQAIDAKVFDKLDSSTLGRVDFIPLAGGVLPTGDAGGVLALAGVAALPTGAGAEIVFSLSAPASVSVSVLNLAGRPVATMLRGRQMREGSQRVLWNGLTSTGTRAPGGAYLVRIEARGDAGQTAQGVRSLTLHR
jgi:hypothetical protein